MFNVYLIVCIIPSCATFNSSHKCWDLSSQHKYSIAWQRHCLFVYLTIRIIDWLVLVSSQINTKIFLIFQIESILFSVHFFHYFFFYLLFVDESLYLSLWSIHCHSKFLISQFDTDIYTENPFLSLLREIFISFLFYMITCSMMFN